MQKRPFYEQTREQDKLFGMALRTHHRTLPRDSFTIHWHKELEFIYIREGEGLFTIDAVSHKVCAGDIVIISPQQLHFGKAIDPSVIVCDVLIFDLKLLDNGLHDDSYKHCLQPVMQQMLTFSPVIHPQDKGYHEI